MGIGVSLAFIAIGAILAFALRVDLSGVDIEVVGWILILVGVVSLGFTLLYTRPRRRRAGQIVDEAPVLGDEPEGVVPERPHERQPVVERVVERQAPPRRTTRNASAQDPAVAQDPAIAQDPAHVNPPPIQPDERRVPRQR
ncbi:DUF6458 family protein [Actinomadura xylanilytica]|uniref:DUF6458 family protein n=1 Tax=Actinomadura xylanilytica TaxID=887459 RepID=UPI00255A9D97|nr:DUF6458 family protein [Actinomadura xylanilytica]MDL4773471.1 DUF6458 family protein [Actinomadura xylanilytica]